MPGAPICRPISTGRTLTDGTEPRRPAPNPSPKFPFPTSPRPSGPQGQNSEREPRDRGPSRATTLRDSELQTLADIGTFRTLTINDLATLPLRGGRAKPMRKFAISCSQGLLRVRTMHPSKAVYAALTRDGHSILNLRRPAGSRQVYYAQFVKPRELRHDAAIYRLYQEVAARIAREGGRVSRIVLDFELKKSINPRLAKLKSLPEPQQEHQRQKIAADHGLTVVDGKIPLPDLRDRVRNRRARADQSGCRARHQRLSPAQPCRQSARRILDLRHERGHGPAAPRHRRP